MDIPFTNHIKIMAVLLVSLSLGACVGETTSSTDTPSSIVISEAAPAATDTTTSTGSTTGTDTTTSTGSTTGTDTTTSTGSTTGTDTTTSTGSTTGTDTTTGTGTTTGTETSPNYVTTQISWTIPTTRILGDALSMSELSGYRVYYGSAPGNYPDSILIEDAQQTSADITLESNQTYYFIVRAIDTDGFESPESNVVTRAL
jgi:hypothetical protein